ncbi:MAG: AMP-binding protein, partial [Kiritimatiellia bacterium]
ARDFVLMPDAETLRRHPARLLRTLLRHPLSFRDRLEREFRPVFLTTTTGRSADPVPFVYTQHDLDNLAAAGLAVCEVLDTRRDFRILNMFPYAPHLAFWQVHTACMAFGVFCASSGGGKVMGTEGNLRLLQKLNPDVLIGMPTFLYHLLHAAAGAGARLKPSLRIVLGGEKAPPGMRAKLGELARALGAEQVLVSATYGLTEARMAWAECPAESGSPGYHLTPGQVLFEVVDPATGEPVPDGDGGELVVTPLTARGTVVARYRTGDRIPEGLRFDRCPLCGRMSLRIPDAISRASEVREMRLEKLKGALVDFNALERLLDDEAGLRSWQIELRKANDDPLDLDRLILHAAPREGVDTAALARHLEDKFMVATEVRPNEIRFLSLADMARLQGVGQNLKEARLVDHRPRA